MRSVPIERTPRVMQLEGLFDIAPSIQSAVQWTAHIPFEERYWDIGLIVGPSGSGKTSIAMHLFGDQLIDEYDWPRDQSVIDAFPQRLGIREIAALLSSVGFSSPPAWLRPYRALSNGEQFRAMLARALTESNGTVVVDEFTSVVDRTAACVGSAAIARMIRYRNGYTPTERLADRCCKSITRTGDAPTRFVAISCHYDIIDWLDPDWVYEPATDAFHWRLERQGCLRIALQICRVHSSAWKIFHRHHYLSGAIHPAARCFTALVDGRPAAFAAVIHFPHPRRSGWREHRLVCLPDYQGVGIGNALSEFVASVFIATGKPYRSTTSHPGMIRHRAKSPLWRMIRPPSRSGSGYRAFYHNSDDLPPTRLTTSFEFVGKARASDARCFGIL